MSGSRVSCKLLILPIDGCNESLSEPMDAGVASMADGVETTHADGSDVLCEGSDVDDDDGNNESIAPNVNVDAFDAVDDCGVDAEYVLLIADKDDDRLRASDVHGGSQ